MRDSKSVVFDLDGTLSDPSARRHLVTGKRKYFDEFYERCGEDTGHQFVIEILRAMATRGYDIQIVSARRSTVEPQTRAWLEKYVGGVDYTLNLVREGDHDHRPDTEIKKLWMDKFGKENILFVVDDRTRVVDMWRDNGVPCLQCDRWEE